MMIYLPESSDYITLLTSAKMKVESLKMLNFSAAMAWYRCVFNWLHLTMEEKQLHWLLFTLLFGGLPILLRSGLVATQSDGSVDYFVFSDIVFFGLMLNASAMANISSEKLVPTVCRKIFILAVVSSLWLIALYSQNITNDLGGSLIAWLFVVLPLLLAFGISHFTSSSREVQALQNECDEKDFAAILIQPLRVHLRSIKDRQAKGEDMNLEKELMKFDAMLDAVNEPVHIGWEATFDDLVFRHRLRRRQAQKKMETPNLWDDSNDGDD